MFILYPKKILLWKSVHQTCY